MSKASDDVLAERERQIITEGWTNEHDDRHASGEMATAAACYALSAAGAIFPEGSMPTFWRWSRNWWKPKGPRRDLVRAAALIIAEIERLDRADDRRTQNKEACVAISAAYLTRGDGVVR
jgi:hypothetical protein